MPVTGRLPHEPLPRDDCTDFVIRPRRSRRIEDDDYAAVGDASTADEMSRTARCASQVRVVARRGRDERAGRRAGYLGQRVTTKTSVKRKPREPRRRVASAVLVERRVKINISLGYELTNLELTNE